MRRRSEGYSILVLLAGVFLRRSCAQYARWFADLDSRTVDFRDKISLQDARRVFCMAWGRYTARKTLPTKKKQKTSCLRGLAAGNCSSWVRSVSGLPAGPHFFGDCARELTLPIHPIVCFEAGWFALTQSSWPKWREWFLKKVRPRRRLYPTPFHSSGGSKVSPTGPTPITILRMVPVNLLSYAS